MKTSEVVLAEPGRDVNPPPWPEWPVFDSDERAAVDAALRSGKVNYWTGNQGRQFEAEYARAIGTRHAIALMNGSVALQLALRMWGIGPGDDVIVTPRTFIASISCVVLQGARPIFADVDRDSGNITRKSIESVLTPRTRAIIPVHLGGWPCEMDGIMELANARGIKVVEDCAQAHGATYKGRAVGGIAHAGAFSFCQDKNITTGGEGGLLATNDEAMWADAWAFKDHGKSFDAVYRRDHPPGFRWLHESFGTNWRMTELQAAIGRIQLAKLPQWSAQRRANASVLREQLAGVSGLRVPQPSSDVQHAYYRFYAYLEPARLRSGWSRERVVAEIAAKGVPSFSGSCSEVYKEKAFAEQSFRPTTSLPVAKELGETSIALLVHPTLAADNMMRAAQIVREVVADAVL
jgi:dTDP-4-amino-4,6-dideoxygalactose transaminase